MNITKDQVIADRNQPIGFLIVNYPDKSEWNTDAFYETADAVIESIRRDEAGYDRKAEFGENNYYKYFKKFKKSYPVMLQYESFAIKGRPFPRFNPVVEVPFLVEVKTWVLSGCHDIDTVQGDLLIYSPESKEDFTGIRGETVHNYPNEMSGKDDGGIILSMIAGADDRTCGTEASRNVFYPLFGTPDQDPAELKAAADLMAEYVKVLAPTAQIEYIEL